MIVEKQVRLVYPKEQLRQPLIYNLIRNYNLLTNILDAHLDSESGWLIILVRGEATQVQKGLEWLKEQGIMVDILAERQEEE
jgi:ABC-type methionine transport system ATPase subunit